MRLLKGLFGSLNLPPFPLSFFLLLFFFLAAFIGVWVSSVYESEALLYFLTSIYFYLWHGFTYGFGYSFIYGLAYG
jgi:hypothetical protein